LGPGDCVVEVVFGLVLPLVLPSFKGLIGFFSIFIIFNELQ